jgi:hypothetical protein
LAGTLQISDGIIYGLDSPLNTNTADNACSLLADTNQTSQYGTFTGTTFTSNKVVNGLLVDYSSSSSHISNSFNSLPCDLIQYEIKLGVSTTFYVRGLLYAAYFI